jgi:hypothetical protein
MVRTNATKSQVGQALYRLAQRIDVMDGMTPMVELLASVVLLIETGTENGLGR